MDNMILNCFEEKNIVNSKLPEEWRSQDALNELSEFLQQNWEQRTIFFDDSNRSSKQQYLSFTEQKGIRTNNYIGTIAFKGRQINIFPKVFRENINDNETKNLNINHLLKNLVCWIKYCNRFNSQFINTFANLDDVSDLRELFITLYVHYVKRAIDRELFYRYEEKMEDLSLIKGQLDLKNYINYKIPTGQQHKIKCNFSEFEFNNQINRIIKHTCKLITSLTENKNNKKILRNILIKLNDVDDTPCKPSDCDVIRLSKSHEYYSIILSMSKIFLLNKMSAYEIDINRSFCFLFPTELLFEGFVGGFISEVLDSEATVTLQASDASLISEIVYGEKKLGKSFLMRHDILIDHKEKGLFILDTKYKQIPRFEGNNHLKETLTSTVKQTDLYQVIEYAAHRDLSNVYLIYPMFRYEDLEPLDIKMIRESVSKKTINIYLVRIPFVFETDVEMTKQKIRAIIRRILEK